MTRTSEVDGIDFDRPNSARMYDYLLGGGHNFAVDRDHATRLGQANPDAAGMARSNRTFLRRAVQWCVRRGIDQFLDLGSGMPTLGHVHEIAHRTLPHARVAYIDHEPVVAAHATELVAGLETVTSTLADLRDVDTVLTAPGVAGLLDFRRPVAVLAISALHLVPGDVHVVLENYRSRLVSGSVLALSHISHDHLDPATTERITALSTAFHGHASTIALRSRTEIAALFGEFPLADPGLVDIIDWPHPRSGDPADATGYYAGLGVAP